MSNNFQIRRASPADAHEIARIHVGATRTAYRGIYTDEYLDSLSVEERAQRWAQTGKGHLVIEDPRFGVFLAIENGKVVGFADVGPCDSGIQDQARLYAIYLEPDYIGRGVGKALFRECVSHARHHGFVNMTIEVLSVNDQARRFYERMQGKAIPESEHLAETGGTIAKVISYFWPSL